MAAAQSVSSRDGAVSLRLVACALLAALSGCALRIAPPQQADSALHLSDAAQEGDATRRASMRLLLQGLDADAAGRANAALSSYERALQIDATNPYAYLALARHEVEALQWDRARESLDQAELLFGEEGATPGVEAHLAGLRGAVADGKGYGAEAEPLLDRAGRLAPSVWADGALGAEELR
jgi:tetratricopeptide (TPR) repeat protein